MRGSWRSSWLPFLIVAEDQPVADRDRAAALSAGVRSGRRLGGLKEFLAALSLDSYATIFGDSLYLWSYLKSLTVADALDR